MIFDIDKQTIKDLELFEDRRNSSSVYSVYNRTATTGGQEMLYKLFKTPISNLDFLQCRKDEINFFYLNNCLIKFKVRQFDFIEHYLSIDRNPLHDNIIDATCNGLLNAISPDSNYWII